NLVELRRLLEQRERFFEANTALYEAASLEQTLRLIVVMAPKLLEVDAALVYLTTENPDELIVAAITPGFESRVVGVVSRTQSINGSRALATRKMVIIEDGPSDPTIHPYLRTVLPSGSGIYVPFFGADQQPIGVMIVMRAKPGPFAESQLQLLKL